MGYEETAPMALPLTGPLSLSQIQAMFGGPIPAALSNYYRKTIQTAIPAYVFTNAQNVDTLLASENGQYPSTFAEGFKHFTSDYGPLFPRDPLAYVSSLGQASIVQVDGENVAQTQGTLWGENAIPRSWGTAPYFKIRAGDTYQFRVRLRALNQPTNTEGNPVRHYINCYMLGPDGFGIYEYQVANNVIDSADGWVTRTATVTGADLLAASPTAVWARMNHRENYCVYTDGAGNVRVVPADITVQTSLMEVSLVSGTPLNGESGITTAYDLAYGDRVLVKSGNTMTVAAGRTSAELGGPRQATNDFTNEIVRLGNFTVVDTPSTQSIPTSGPIKLSDFYGTSQDAAPQFTTPTELGNVYPGQPFSFTFNATSVSPVTYSMISSIPGDWTWNPTTHTVSGVWSINNISAAIQRGDFIIGASNDYLTTSQQFLYTVVNQTPVWTTADNTSWAAIVGEPFSQQLQASDPEGSGVLFIVHDGALPPGIGISSAGLLSGTPTTPGTFNFEVRLEDNVPRGSAGSHHYSIIVDAGLAGGGGGGGGGGTGGGEEGGGEQGAGV